MPAWPRLFDRSSPLFTSAAALAAVLFAATPASATPAEDAAKLADEGKGMSADGNNAGASEKFRQAVVLSPEGKFYLYLCISLSKEGKLGEALNACDAVERNGADEKTLTKTRAMMESLRADMRKQGMDPDKALAEGRAQPDPQDPVTPGGGAAPGGGGSSAVDVPAAMPQYVGAPPASVYGIKTVPHEYTWSLGATLFGAGTAIGKEGAYDSAGGGILLHGDLLMSKAYKFGAQAYLGVTSVGGQEDEDGINYDDLTIVDFGLAGFKHLCFGRVCATPLVGVHLSGMQPSSESETEDEISMFTVGVRAEGTLAATLGSRYEHVISASLGVNAYAPAIGDYEEQPDFYGLDEASSAVYFGIGYSYRFNTPIGQSPFITFD